MVWILNQASQSGSSSQVEMAKCTWNRQLVDASMKRSRPSLPASSSAATVPFQRPCTLQDQNPSGAWGDPQISSELAPSSGPLKVFDDYITMSHQWTVVFPLQLVDLLTAALPGLRIHREKVPGREHSSHLGGSFQKRSSAAITLGEVFKWVSWFNHGLIPAIDPASCKFLIVYQCLVA